jgi:peptidoglycan/xylan/chitin deacetylase (PgdA/CDA1 family)
MIIELIGLPGTGKTALAEAMKAKGATLISMLSRARLIFEAGLFWFLHPLLAIRLLAHIMRASRNMRYALVINGFVGYAARYRRAMALSRAGAIVVLDQGFFQLLVSLGELPPALLKLFPRPDILVAVTADVSVREERMASRGWAPREELGHKGRLVWQQRAEAALYEALPSIEKSINVYHYWGAQDPAGGATMLMAFAAKQPLTTMRTSFARNLLKTTIAAVSFIVAQFLHIFQREPQVIVLMYHAVDNSGWKLSVTPEMFERQMRYLAWKGWAMPLADIVSYAKGEKKFPAHAVAVTFDDGYRDLLTTVLPILEQYHIQATVFIPSDMSARTSPDNKPRLTEGELRILAQSPFITIGSHAKTHRKFTELALEEMKNEAEKSADMLARVTGTRPRFFAYPYGARSVSAERAVEAVGYEAAFGITDGTIHQGDDRYRLKRVQIDGTMNFLLFRLRLTAAVDWNRRIVDLLRRIP